MEIELPKINSRLLIWGIIALFFVVMLSLLHTKFYIFNDEAIYSDITHRFLQGKDFSTPLFRDFIPEIEKHSYWYPPIYFLFLAIGYSLFEVSITVARLFTLTTATALLCLIPWILGKKSNSKIIIILCLLLLAGDHYFQDSAVVARMEMLALFLSVLAMVFHIKFLEKEKLKDIFFSGVFSALSLLTHPIAVIILFPITLNLLIFSKLKWKQKLLVWSIYSSPIIIGLVLWTVSFWPNKELFWLQNMIQLQRKTYAPYFAIELFKHKPLHRIILTLYYLSNSLFVLNIFKNKHFSRPVNRLLIFLAVSSTFLPIIMKEMWYLLFTTFFGAIFLTLNLETWWQTKKYWLMVIPAIILMLSSFIFFGRVNEIVQTPDDYQSFSARVADKLPQNAKILLASYPDPFFYLEKERPDLNMRSAPNNFDSEPINYDVYNTILTDVEFVLSSPFFTNSHLRWYIENNLDEIVLDNNAETGGYQNWLIKLKPLNERVIFEKLDENK